MNYDKLISGNSAQNSGGISNLKPWPKGVSGNPGGRPKKSLLQKHMEERLNDEKYVDKLLDASYKTACGNGMAAVMERRQWLDRIDGPVAQEIELTGRLDSLPDEDLSKRLLKLIGAA